MPKMYFYWHNISRWALIALAGLAPIFFLPFTSLQVAANKEILVFSLVLVAFFALLGKILVESKIRYPGHLLMLALLVLVLVWGVSTFFSLNPLTSLIGNWATPDSFASIVLFALLMLSVVMTFDRKDIILSILVFLASLSLLGTFEILQLLKVYILPFDFAKGAAWNPVGTPNDLGILLAFGLVIASGLISSTEMSKLLKKLLGIAIAIFIIDLAVIDFWAIWVGLILAAILMISFLSSGLKFHSDSPNQRGLGSANQYQGLQLIYFQKAWLPSIILLVSLLFLFIPSPLANFISTPPEVSPNFTATLNIALANLKSGHYLAGSGPNTFSYIFNLYKPDGINQTIFWSTVFNAGASAMATWAGTVGIMGILSLLFLIIAFVWTGLKGTEVCSSSRGIMNIASQSIFVGVVYLFLMWFLYMVNFTVLAFTFWGMGLFLAASLFEIRRTEEFAGGEGMVRRIGSGVFKEFMLFTSPPKTFLFSLVLIGFMVGAIAGIYFEANRYVAEIYFSKAVAASNLNDNNTTINDLSRAIQFWPYDEKYFQNLAQAIFFQLNDLFSRKDLSQDQVKTRFQNITSNAVAAAKQAQTLNPENPFNDVLLGSIYENLIPYVSDAASFALSSYGAAIGLDPKNPANYLALGRVEAGKKDKDLDKAVSDLNQSIGLKNDYAPARFLLVQILDQQGKLSEAVKSAEELVTLNNTDVGALFQLGFLYYKNNQFNESQQVFEKLIGVSPNYSNARYFLGLIYDRAGNKDKAIEQFSKISELNPDNNEVKRILANLKSKKPALFGISPPGQAPQNRETAPIQEGARAPVQKLRK